MLRWLRNNFELAKIIFYSGISLVTSITSIALQADFKQIFVSSIFNIGFEGVQRKVLKSTSGFLERQGKDEQCELKIVMPFDFPPPAISEENLCYWTSKDEVVDSLCYTDFGCEGVDIVHRLSLVAPALFILGYIMLGGLLLVTNRVKPLFSKRLFIIISFLGIVSVFTGFVITKTIPYITDYFLKTVFDKIRSVTINKGGVNYLEFENIKYVLDRKIVAARTLLDIMAGFSAVFVIMIIERYRKTHF
jgi:hypothetical protein